MSKPSIFNLLRLSCILACIIPLQQILYSQNISRSSTSDTTSANEYFHQAHNLFMHAQYDSSIIFLEKAGMIYEKEHLGQKHIQCLIKIGESYSKKFDYDNSIKYLDRALALELDKCGGQCLEIAKIYHLFGNVYCGKGDLDKALQYDFKALKMNIEILGERNLSVADCNANIGVDYYDSGDYDKAIQFQQKALSIRLEVLGEKHPDIAHCYINIGDAYSSKGNYDKALQYQLKALAIDLDVLGEKHTFVAGIYNNIGNVYCAKGDYEKALQFDLKALSINLEVLGEKHPYVAGSYNNIGDIYHEKGDYDKSIQYLQKALSIRLAALGENNPDVAASYMNIGIAYYSKGDYDKSLQFNQKGLSIFLEVLGKQHHYVALSYLNIGNAHSKKGEHNKALQFIRKAISINLAAQGEKNPDVAIMYQNMGEIFLKQNKPTRALEYFQNSLISLAQDFHENNIYINPAFKNISSEPILLSTLELKAEALDKLYRIKSKNLKDLICAESTYKLASNLINKMRQSYQSEGSQLQLGEHALRIYEKAITTALQLYEITHKNEYKEKAFAFSEKGKASVILQALSKSQAKQFAGIPNILLEKEKDIKIDLAFYEKILFEEQAKGKQAQKSKITQWQNKLFSLNRQNDSLTQRFETEYPEYYDLKYRTSIISPKEIQSKLLKKDDILVEYFTGDSSIYTFTLTQQTLNVTTVKKDTLFEKQVKSMKEGLTKRNYALYTENAYRIYQTLIEPIKADITNKNLIVIPDGILGYIPFETLLTRKADSGSKDYRQLAYLIKDNQISYDYSATLLYENTTKGRKKNERLYVGFAPVTFK